MRFKCKIEKKISYFYKSLLNFIKKEHESNCIKRPVTCSKCSQVVLTQDLRDHVEFICPEEITACNFVHHGCTEKVIFVLFFIYTINL